MFEPRFTWKEGASYEKTEEHCLSGRGNSKDKDSQARIGLQGWSRKKVSCTKRSVWEKVWDAGSTMALVGCEYLKEKVYFNLSAMYEFFIVTKNNETILFLKLSCLIK